MQQEMVTSGKIPEFAEPVAEVEIEASGGEEMVREGENKEGRREGRR